MLGESGDKPRTGIDFVNPRLEVKAEASENGKGVPPNMLMIMTFTGRASSSANDGPAKSAVTRTLAPASKYLVIDRTVSNILWLCMEAPPFLGVDICAGEPGEPFGFWQALHDAGMLQSGCDG